MPCHRDRAYVSARQHAAQAPVTMQSYGSKPRHHGEGCKWRCFNSGLPKLSLVFTSLLLSPKPFRDYSYCCRDTFHSHPATALKEPYCAPRPDHRAHPTCSSISFLVPQGLQRLSRYHPHWGASGGHTLAHREAARCATHE